MKNGQNKQEQSTGLGKSTCHVILAPPFPTFASGKLEQFLAILR